MYKNKKLSSLKVPVIVLILAITGLAFFMTRDNLEVQSSSQNIAVSDSPNESISIATQNPNSSIATAWQWDNLPTKKQVTDIAENKETTRFDVDYIYNALQAVKLDEDGDVVIDHQTLLALNETLAYSGLRLDREDLAELQDLIKLGLPGKSGEQTAEIVGNYYQYLDAERELNTLYSADGPSTNAEVQYEEILALRELYLGKDVSDGLFAMSNANARYMFESFRIESDSSLTDEEKRERQLENVKHHAEQTTEVFNWNVRYADFLAAKKKLQGTALIDDVKNSHLTELMQQHFTQEELEKVRHLKLGVF